MQLLTQGVLNYDDFPPYLQWHSGFHLFEHEIFMKEIFLSFEET